MHKHLLISALLVMGLLMLALSAARIAADVPVAPRLLSDGALVAKKAEAEVPGKHLRNYLRGNSMHGWNLGQLGKPTEFWNQRVDALPVDATSQEVTQYLGYVSRKDKTDSSSEFFGQFDMGKKVNGENYSHNVLEADNSTPLYPFRPRLLKDGFRQDDFFAAHCDKILMPVPAGGRLQNEADYRCTTDSDCHLYVVNTENGRIYEQWRAFNPGPDLTAYSGGCANYWDLSKEQEPNLRGLSCSSANAAGLPYIPLLVTPGEIKEGVIRHALAFTLPNAWVRRDLYVRPATHNPLRSAGWGNAESAPGTPMLYGSRFRLRGDFTIDSQWPAALRVILQALKDYGMFHIDGGARMIITSNDALSAHSWEDPEIQLNPFDLTGKAGLNWADFELVSDATNLGSMANRECVRKPIEEF
jgi:serine/threonine-protein kinase